ncbi:hypothetical protein U0070_023719 [Myodes glareolus]|uniref:Uncharacterized protein n=1 Tax=Myodes glareolus TaxID=447135 RepID=A0AAW0H019_MYOGA
MKFCCVYSYSLLMTVYQGGKSFEAWCLSNPLNVSYLRSLIENKCCVQRCLSGIRDSNF